VIKARSLTLAAACVLAPAGLVVASELAPAREVAAEAPPSITPAARPEPERREPQPTVPPAQLTGLLLPRQSAEIGALIAGKLVAVHVQLGDRVREGQPIATLDTRLASADIAAAEAAVRSQQAERALAAAAERAAREHELRVRALADHGLAPGEDLARAAQDSERARLRAQGSSSLLTQKVAQLERLSLERHLMQVRAPFPGIVAARYLDPGATVSATGSQPIVRVISEALILRAALPEGQAGRVMPGSRVRARSTAGDVAVIGRVERAAAEVDPIARVWMVEAAIEGGEAGATVMSPITAGLEMHVEVLTEGDGDGHAP